MSDLTVRIISQEIADAIVNLAVKLGRVESNDNEEYDLTVAELTETVGYLGEKNVVEELAQQIASCEGGLESRWIVNIEGFENFYEVAGYDDHEDIVEKAKERLNKLPNKRLIEVYSKFKLLGEKGYKVDKFIWSHSEKKTEED